MLPRGFAMFRGGNIDLLLSLNTSKANGPDGISATMLKSTAYSIAPTLTKLFNESISSGKLPSTWKHLPLFQYQKVMKTLV